MYYCRNIQISWIMLPLEHHGAPNDSKMDTVVPKDIKATSLTSWGIIKQCMAHIEYQSGLARVPYFLPMLWVKCSSAQNLLDEDFWFVLGAH